MDFASAVERAIETTDCVIVLWSIAASQSEFAALELKHAIKAWSEDRLVLVALDDTPLPMGLRDQSAIRFTHYDDYIQLDQIAKTVRRLAPLERPGRPRFAEPPEPSASSPSRKVVDAYPERHLASKSGRSKLPADLIAVLIGSGLLGIFIAWLFIQAADATKLLAAYVLMWVALAVGAAIALFAVYRFYSRRPAKIAARVQLPAAPASRPAPNADVSRDVFISYSWKDSRVVESLVSRIEAAGYGVWIDRTARDGASARYAGPIVRAIRSSRVVAVMCSRNAFGSDHVVREVYVAGDFKKPFLRVDLDGADVPDELLYFLTGFPRMAPTEFEGGDFKLAMQRVVA